MVMLLKKLVIMRNAFFTILNLSQVNCEIPWWLFYKHIPEILKRVHCTTKHINKLCMAANLYAYFDTSKMLCQFNRQNQPLNMEKLIIKF